MILDNRNAISRFFYYYFSMRMLSIYSMGFTANHNPLVPIFVVIIYRVVFLFVFATGLEFAENVFNQFVGLLRHRKFRLVHLHESAQNGDLKQRFRTITIAWGQEDKGLAFRM